MRAFSSHCELTLLLKHKNLRTLISVARTGISHIIDSLLLSFSDTYTLAFFTLMPF